MKLKFKKIIKEQVFCPMPKDDYNITFTAHECAIVCLKEQIALLTDCIEHPNKPGYKRNDIIEKINELKKKIKRLKLDLKEMI